MFSTLAYFSGLVYGNWWMIPWVLGTSPENIVVTAGAVPFATEKWLVKRIPPLAIFLKVDIGFLIVAKQAHMIGLNASITITIMLGLRTLSPYHHLTIIESL